LLRLGAAGMRGGRAAFALRLPDAVHVACAYVTLGHVQSPLLEGGPAPRRSTTTPG
jgi:hypothetical protein